MRNLTEFMGKVPQVRITVEKFLQINYFEGYNVISNTFTYSIIYLVASCLTHNTVRLPYRRNNTVSINTVTLGISNCKTFLSSINFNSNVNIKPPQM